MYVSLTLFLYDACFSPAIILWTDDDGWTVEKAKTIDLKHDSSSRLHGTESF